MPVSYERWHQIAKDLKTGRRSRTGEKLSSFPALDTEALLSSEDHSQRTLAEGYLAARDLPRRLKMRKAELEENGIYSDQGRAQQLEEFSKTVVTPGLESLRGKLLPRLREEAAERTRDAQAKMPQPQTNFEIAIAEAAWKFAREEKLDPVAVSKASPEVQAAVSLAPPEIVGMSSHSHHLVRKAYVARFGGPEMVAAESFSEAVDTLSRTLEYAEVALDLEHGREPDHPLKVERPKGVEKSEGAVASILPG